MRVYYGFGHQEFGKQEFLEHIADQNLSVVIGQINSARILERRFLSNQGNALECRIRADMYGYSMNLGNLPRGTGCDNYGLFLEEIECSSVFGYYLLPSLEGKTVLFLERSGIARGWFVPECFYTLME